jgi:phage terminase large subunit-like protein
MPFDFACPDWEERLQRGETPIADLPIDEEAGEEAVRIFNHLRLPDVIGNPPLREAAGDWIRDIVRMVFGSMLTSADGYLSRKVGEVFILVPKKNSKTTSSAGIALTFMLLNKRPKADMLIIGPTQKIADVAFEQAKGMIEADPEGYLRDRFHVQDHKKTIVDRINGTRLMVRTFGMDVLTGAKPIFCLIDEIHVLGSVHYAADVIRQIRGGMLPFPESLLVMITTQSDHSPAGVFKTELQYARGVRDGSITESVKLLAVLYEFPEAVQTDKKQPWLNPDLWHLVTPNLGKSISIEALREGFERAKADGMGEVIAWATQHLNVQVGMALHVDRWIGADHWPAAGDKSISFERILDECEVACAGIDGGGLDDLFALSIIGRHRETKRWMHWAHAWAHPEVFELRKDIAPRLLAMADMGDLTQCEDPTQDIDEACDWIMRVHDARLFPEAAAVGLDPFGVAALIDALIGAGIGEDQLASIPQGARLSQATWGLERKLKDGTFVHGAQELMTFSVGNAIAEQRGNAVLITKQTAGKAKIDPLVATLNAVTLMARNPKVSRRSIESMLSRPVMNI